MTIIVRRLSIKARMKRIVDLNSKNASKFFLDNSSYSSIDLPPYFHFGPMLTKLEKQLRSRSLSLPDLQKFKNCSGVNYEIFAHKGDRYSWRKLQLINPVLYTKLVQEITTPQNWLEIQNRFQEFSANPSITCMSVPVTKSDGSTRLANQIFSWLENVERESVRLSLKYEHMYKTDISNCYSSIYTHSVAWALHTKAIAKNNRGPLDNLGNLIDTFLQSMSNGQTNGIPEGSSLMDFIAEMVLGYADIELTERLKVENISPADYRIIRYRDDYRIFVKDEPTGEKILMCLAQVLMDLGLRLNPSKTGKAGHLVLDSVKPAKLSSYERHRHKIRNPTSLRNELLYILDKSQNFPDNGFCKTSMSALVKEVKSKHFVGHEKEILAILVNIAFERPDCFHLIATLISKLLSGISSQKDEIFQDIHRKIRLLPNSGLLEIWLQRIAKPHNIVLTLSEPLCDRLTVGSATKVFNDQWQQNSSLANIQIDTEFIDQSILKKMKREIANKEVLLFYRYY